jgi:signal transduction histidine kinase
MKLNLQTLERHKLDEEKKNQLVSRCIHEASRLNDLCNNMLIASQMEGKQYRAAREKIDFSALVEHTLQDYMIRYPGRFEEGPIFKAELNGDRLLLNMAVNNLMENAVKYTPEDKTISVKLTTGNNVAVLQVIDQGQGIPDKEKNKIFNKFYRVGNEETRKTKGTGLGLYLTSKIVMQHRGKISVKDNEPHGCVFEISLPLV